jgi:cytoskeletal protein CcmA (bactofilin family)
MWKKEEDQSPRPVTPAPSVTTPEPPRAPTGRVGFATIGPSIVIRGEVSGDEDLVIQGQVDGSVTLGRHAVTVGNGGRVKAGITGRLITIEGAVEGDLKAEEQIVLRGTARVRGDLNAPRVVLEDGASFRGLVDMGSTEDLDMDGPVPTSAKAGSPTARSMETAPSTAPKGTADPSTPKPAQTTGARSTH